MDESSLHRGNLLLLMVSILLLRPRRLEAENLVQLANIESDANFHCKCICNAKLLHIILDPGQFGTERRQVTAFE